MINPAEKLEECPKCGHWGDNWIYDSQVCKVCDSVVEKRKRMKASNDAINAGLRASARSK